MAEVGFLIVVLVIVFLSSAIRVAREFERGVVLRLGKLTPPERGPGLFLIIPFVDKVTMVDLRVKTVEIPPQEIITKDNVTIKVTAVVYFSVINPIDAVLKVENYYAYTFQRAQTTLRSIIGQFELDELLAEREKINLNLQKVIDEATEPWGVKVTTVEIKDVELPQGMQRAIARQAEAEREKRAKIIFSEGEFQASQKFAEAASVIQKEPAAIQLRFLQTLSEIAVEKNSTIIFPFPIELFKGILNVNNKENT
jgi:regulator of protease activity HflC (stomatin/prohibitin superfamily)